MAIVMEDLSAASSWQLFTTTTANKQAWNLRMFLTGDTGDVNMTVSGGTVYLFNAILSRGVKLLSDSRPKEDVRSLTASARDCRRWKTS
jgi:hypothetical protein